MCALTVIRMLLLPMYLSLRGAAARLSAKLKISPARIRREREGRAA